MNGRLGVLTFGNESVSAMRRLLLVVDGILHLSMGIVLVSFQPATVEFLNLPVPDHPFYCSCLGAILAGIGVSLLLEGVRAGVGAGVRGSRVFFNGVGLGGAVTLNVSSVIVLFFWLVGGTLEVSSRGNTVLWSVTAVLTGLSAIEWQAQRGKIKLKPAPSVPNSAPPTHFLSLRIDSPEIVERIRKLQDDVVTQEPGLEQALVPACQLHLTLCVVTLSSEDQKERARQVMSQIKQEMDRLFCAPPSVVVQGTGNFKRNNVVFARVVECETVLALQELARHSQMLFQEADITVQMEAWQDIPHITIIKLSRLQRLPKNRRKAFVREVDPSLYAPSTHMLFGQQKFEELHLCAMKNKEKDGYYLREETVFFQATAHEHKD